MLDLHNFARRISHTTTCDIRERRTRRVWFVACPFLCPTRYPPPYLAQSRIDNDRLATDENRGDSGNSRLDVRNVDYPIALLYAMACAYGIKYYASLRKDTSIVLFRFSSLIDKLQQILLQHIKVSRITRSCEIYNA